ncbi:MAG: prepilin-type N-terminal cleavage/methylation domain-containing protein [Candidatus Cloacimonetes bacterium]|nr:prepilin-type N-terminal cleavage/methylation domain-containing protein [Candidatus Cloacimonadota bacterium]
MKLREKGFTLAEMMIVVVILIMVMGVTYSFYMNMTRVYAKGSEHVLKILDAQIPLEIMCHELRSAVRIVELKPDLIVFDKYYEPTGNESDPVKDLNSVKHKTVHFRVRKDDEGYYHLERKEERDFFEPLQPAFSAKELNPNVFRGWKMVRGKLTEYNSFKWNSEDIPMLEIRLHFTLKDNQEVDFYRRVFLPVPFAGLPRISAPEDVFGDSD